MNEETLKEIIAWLRDPKIKSPMRKTWREVLANRLEKAAKREKAQHGNAAAMREALLQCELFLGNVSRHGHPTLNPGDKCTACDGVDELRGLVVRALAAPPRNCDVGTPEEQSERFAKYCDRFHRCNGCTCCGKVKYNRCEYFWAQMPYTAK